MFVRIDKWPPGENRPHYLVEGKKITAKFCCGYFTAHAYPMKYDEYLAAGLPIATGVIEEEHGRDGCCQPPPTQIRT
ncbi:MAG TPA: hypothetical protein PLR25_17700 [Planctomycetaceae bacterium]|nr:hypothetical protein [Planctomycetaceae bacterium]